MFHKSYSLSLLLSLYTVENNNILNILVNPPPLPPPPHPTPHKAYQTCMLYGPI